MVKWTFKAFETWCAFNTRLCFIHQRMELLFFPTMTVYTLLKSFATLLVASYKCSALPIFTKLNFIYEQVRSSAKVLVIVGVKTLCFVVFVIEGTPLCFEIVYVKVKVLFWKSTTPTWSTYWLNEMNATHLNIFDWVSEAAVLSIFTEMDLARVHVAKFCLVFVWVVETFDSIMRSATLFVLGTPFWLSKLT